jgi:hypothetical protein
MAKDLFGTEHDPSGAPKRIIAKRGEALRWFNEHINDEADECTIWPFAKVNGEYGILKKGGKMRVVTELVCERRYGPKPGPDYEARHGSCNTPACMNYRHLGWGTSKQNRQDQIRDGTNNIGTRNGNSKLTVKDVITIRELSYLRGMSGKEIAAQFQISEPQISGIIRGKLWKHVPMPNSKDLFK